ncbi:MAG: EAL domain-containing protein [Thiomicrospira sp.]|uniref:putative bifunctional diguanylate cyclase/phosphodiesterase n=1 Tax=Thiomicrospira sp. TaxID=935 RepID=UPI0019DDCD0E|nr:EAL domain-containing protein [Thiomicrospira sp.]MBE0492844.1 EAL domain-containing protein [Thiomicrospira sp.]
MRIRKWLGLPIGVSLTYAILAGLWIGLSDYILVFLVKSPDLLVTLSLTKGLLFVAITALLLYVLLTSWQGLNRLERVEKPLIRYNRWLIAGFFATALMVPIISGGLIWKQTPQVERETRDRLMAFSQLQADLINNWLAERQGDANNLASDVFLMQAIQRWLIVDEDSGLEQILDRVFTNRIKAYGYDAIEVYSAGQLVKYWGGKAHTNSNILSQLISDSGRAQEVMQSSLYKDEQGVLHLEWLIPFPAEDMERSIVLVLHASPADILLKALQHWSAAPDGAMSYLVVQEGNTPKFLGLDEAGRAVVEFSCMHSSWLLQVQGVSDLGSVIKTCDDEKMVFGYTDIQNANWTVFTQMTQGQARDPLRELVGWVTLISSLAMVALMLMLWMIWRRELMAHKFEIETRAAEKDALIDYVSHYDHITGLPNRVLFMTRLSHQIKHAKREHKKMALIMLDLDRFKDVNDSYGHAVGDELLAALASRLSDQLGQMNTLARMGGDEFAVLIEDLPNTKSAEVLAHRIAQNISQPLQLTQGAEVRVGVTMGISVFPDHGQNADALLQNADAALYRAKADGKGSFAFYNDELTELARQRVRQELQLKQAIFKKHLKVYYQPQVDLKSNHIVGAEALIRWLDPEKGFISPLNFIPMAEETGLIQEIGEWVLREVCTQGQAWLAQGYPPFRLAVNVSAQQLRHGGVDKLIKKILDETGFPARYLELELTESALMQEVSHIDETLIKLRQLGLTLALDDFGTGYSSLSYLKRFALDVIKIDQSFVADLSHEQNGQQIVNAIITMGHALGLCVLAEGVENTDQLAYLMQHDCDLYQGFLVSQAIPADDFMRLYQKSLT